MNPSFESIIGHKKQCDYLKHVLESGNVAHAYCFSGSKGLGKATIAKEFAERLLSLETDKLQTSPNVTIVSDENGKIGVEEIRALKQTLSLSTFGGGWKIAIINGADSMTTSAQNALLKTLEEPTPQTVLILISHNSDALLETIRSRVATIEFNLLPVDQIVDALEDRFGVKKQKAQLIAQLSMGRAGVAFVCSDEENCKEQEEKAQEALQFLQDPLYERMRKIELITKTKEDRQRVIQNMVELWRMWLHEGLLYSLGMSSADQVKDLAGQSSGTQIKKALSTLHECERALDRNVQPALALQVFASSF